MRDTETKIRVLTTIFEFQPCIGGAENVALCLVKNTNCGTMSNNVLTVATERVEKLCGDRFIKSENPDGRFRIDRFRLLHILGRERNGSYAMYANLALYIANLIKNRSEYDIIHAHSYYWPAVASILAGRLCKKKVIVTGHNTLRRLLYQIEYGDFPRWVIPILRRADVYVAISRGIERECRDILKLDGSRLRYIPNGIDENRYRPARDEENRRRLRHELGLPLDVPLVVSHGRLAPHKNLETLIRAVSVLRSRSIPVHALIIGTGPHLTALRKLALEQGISDGVSFLDFRTNVGEYLRCSDMYCLCSSYEGHPLALLEAMSSGLVCIASNIDGNRDIIDDGRNGFLFEPSREDVLPDLIARVLAAGKEISALRGASRDTVMSKFTLTAMVGAYKQLYSDVFHGVS